MLFYRFLPSRPLSPALAPLPSLSARRSLLRWFPVATEDSLLPYLVVSPIFELITCAGSGYLPSTWLSRLDIAGTWWPHRHITALCPATCRANLSSSVGASEATLSTHRFGTLTVVCRFRTFQFEGWLFVGGSTFTPETSSVVRRSLAGISRRRIWSTRLSTAG